MNPRLEKNLATRFPTAVAKVPCLKKHDLAIRYLIEGFVSYMIEMEKQYGPGYREVFKKTQYQLGRSMGEQIKHDYHLGNDLNAAVDMMWMFIVPFGITMTVTPQGPSRIREEKTRCPIYDVFKKLGVNYCDELCLSMTAGWLAAINKNLRFEMIQNATPTHYCIKEIIDSRYPVP
jgi:hypothetical protein